MRPRIVLFVGLMVVGAITPSCSGSSAPAASPPSRSAPPAPTISEAWVRPGRVGQGTAAYLKITGGSAADALLSASSPGAATVELHETTTDSAGMTGMHPIASLRVAAGAAVALEPGGHHLMIMGLTKALAVGDKLELDLHFQNAGEVVVEAEVKAG